MVKVILSRDRERLAYIWWTISNGVLWGERPWDRGWGWWVEWWMWASTTCRVVGTGVYTKTLGSRFLAWLAERQTSNACQWIHYIQSSPWCRRNHHRACFRKQVVVALDCWVHTCNLAGGVGRGSMIKLACCRPSIHMVWLFPKTTTK